MPRDRRIAGAADGPVLMGVSGTLRLLFAAEIFLAFTGLAASASLGVRGRPFAFLLALSGMFFLGALTSYPVVVGWGLGTGVKRTACLALVLLAVGMAGVTLLDLAESGELFARRDLEIEARLRDLDFDLEYFDGPRDGEDFARLTNRRKALAGARVRLEETRSHLVASSGAVLGACILFLVMNLVQFVEVNRLHTARKRRPDGGSGP